MTSRFQHIVNSVCLCCNIRDHDMTDLDDPHLVALMRKGTIPPSLSLRAPPTHIGTSNHRNDVLGITKEEVSKRYIIKLQRDRVRNNQAVYKSLDNLPIKIRQVAQSSFDKSSKSSSSTYKSRKKVHVNVHSTPEEYQKSQNVKTDQPAGNTNSGNNLRKQKMKVKVYPKVENNLEVTKSKDDEETQHFTFEPHTLNMLQSEMPYIFSAGFQGYQNRLKASRRKPVAFGQTVKINNNHDFQKRYQRVLDSNQQSHLVKTSLIKGNRVNNSYHKLNVLSNRLESAHGDEIFAIKSVERYNEPLIFMSPASPTRVPNPSLYSECQTTEMSLNINGIPTSPHSRPASSNLAEMDSSDNSSHGDPGNEFLQSNKNNIAGTNDSADINYNRDDEGTRVPTLSLELLRVHEHATSANTKQTYNACNLTDITERDESNLTKTTRSEPGPDMKISIRINYKSKEEVIDENTSNSSRKSKSRESSKQLRITASSESKRSGSTLSEKPLDNLIVQGYLIGEKSDLEKYTLKEIRHDVNDIEQASYPNEDDDVPKIIVDLNRLKTVKTPKTKIKAQSRDENVRNEKSETKMSNMKSETNNQANVILTKPWEKNEFFLTDNNVDSALSQYEDSTTPKFDEAQETNDIKETPRTEIDDSGISISTFENEAIKF